jgi:hypothetical protein
MRIFDSSKFMNYFFQNSQYLRNFQFTTGSAVLFSINTGVPELADQIETVYSLMVMKVKNV